MKDKKYLLEVNAVGTLEEIILNLVDLVQGLEVEGINLVIEEKQSLEENEILYNTTVMTADIKPLG